MPDTRLKQPDQQRIVAGLAQECHLPVGEMATLYEHARAQVAVGAHVTRYLHILATRRVLELLELRAAGGPAATANAAAGPGAPAPAPAPAG